MDDIDYKEAYHRLDKMALQWYNELQRLRYPRDTKNPKKMTKEEFKTIRLDLDLSLSEMARALRVKSARGVRYYETGERPVSGPVARHMAEFRDGKPV